MLKVGGKVATSAIQCSYNLNQTIRKQSNNLIICKTVGQSIKQQVWAHQNIDVMTDIPTLKKKKKNLKRKGGEQGNGFRLREKET